MDILRWLLDQASLSTNLSSNLVVRKTGGGENRNLLSSGNGVHRINSGDTGRDHFLRVHLVHSLVNHPTQFQELAYSRVRVDRLPIDIQVVLGQNLRTLINRTTRAIENTTQHVLRHTEFQAVTGELNFSLLYIVSKRSPTPLAILLEAIPS